MSKIKASALLICVAAGFLSNVANAQTLDSLITKQRQALIDDANKQGSNKGIPNASAVPQQLQISQTEPQLTHLPALPGFGIPGSAVVPQEPPPKPIIKALFEISDAQLVAIYGVGDELTAEVAYNGYLSKVQKRSEVIDGWIVQEITGKSVLLSKVVQKGKSVSTISHILRFNQGTGEIATQTVPQKVKKAKKTSPRKQVKGGEVATAVNDGVVQVAK